MRLLARAPALLCALSLLVATTEVSAAAPTKDPQAQKYLDKGRSAYQAEEWDKAADFFEKAYEIEPTPELLYALAQAKRLGGHCDEAVPLYNEFLATNPGGDLPQLAKEAKSVCADELVAAAAAKNEEDAQEEEVDDLPEDEPLQPVVEDGEDDKGDRDPGTRRWYQDPLGGALVGAGVAGVGAGVGLIVAAQVEQGKDSSNYGDFADRRDRVRNFRIAGGVVLGVGAALLIGGAVRWGILARREKKGVTAGLMMDGSTAGFTLSGRF